MSRPPRSPGDAASHRSRQADSRPRPRPDQSVAPRPRPRARTEEGDGQRPRGSGPRPDGATGSRHQPGDHRAGPADATVGEDDERQLWCDTCEAMVPVGDLDDDDCCPTCGEPIGGRKIPWKFRLMIAASVIYLGYRAFQGITWVVHHA